MTKQDVEQRVEDIRTRSKDYEAAHGMEDALHQDVLKAIAEGAENAAELATAALKTLEIEFPRYCA